jgi:ATP-dependent Lhr-like helicase
MNVQTARDDASLLPEPFLRWFAGRGWTPRAHQLELLTKARAGRSVLLIAPTGAGKTLAGFLPTLVELSTAAGERSSSPRTRSAPSPLVGEGWGGGWRSDATLEPQFLDPHP